MATHTSRLVALSAFVALGAGCNMAPRYARPIVDVPSEYRGARADTARAESLGEAKWSEVFRDEELQKLIRKAVEENNDIRIAAARVLQARAQLTITRADQLPTVTAERDGNQRANADDDARRSHSSGVDRQSLRRRRDAVLGARLLGQIPQRHRSGESHPARHAVGGASRARHRRQLGRAELLHAARARSRAGDRATRAGGARGVAAADARSGSGGRRVVAGCASGRAARVHRGVGHHEHPTPDHAAGERAEHSAGAEPRADSARPPVGRSAGAARGADRLAVGAARAATRYPSGRASADRGERSHRRREGRAVSTDRPDSQRGLSEQRAVDAAFRTGGARARDGRVWSSRSSTAGVSGRT